MLCKRVLLALFFPLLLLLTPVNAETVFNNFNEIVEQDVSAGGDIIQNCVKFDPSYSTVQTLTCTDCNASFSLFDGAETVVSNQAMTARKGGQFYYTLTNMQYYKTPFTYAAVFYCTDTAGNTGNITAQINFLTADGMVAETGQIFTDDDLGALSWFFGDWYKNIVDSFIPSDETGEDGLIVSVFKSLWVLVEGTYKVLLSIPALAAFILFFLSDPLSGVERIIWYGYDLIGVFAGANFLFFIFLELSLVGLAILDNKNDDTLQGFLNSIVTKHLMVVNFILSIIEKTILLITTLIETFLSLGTAVTKLIP